MASKSDLSILVDKVVADGVMSREEYDLFIELVHQDGEIDEDEANQLSRVFDLVKQGKIEIRDPSQDKFEKKH